MSYRKWKDMSNEDLIHHVRIWHYGDTLSEFGRGRDNEAYNECGKRKIFFEGKETSLRDFLVKEGTLIKKYRDDGHWENFGHVEQAINLLIAKLGHFPTAKEMQENKMGVVASKIQECHNGLNAVKIKMGYTPQEKSSRYWKDMSDWDLIHYVRSWHYGDKINDFHHAQDCAAYAACLSRKIKTENGKEIRILDFLVEEGTLIRTARASGTFQRMTDEEIKNQILASYKGEIVSRINSDDNRLYEEASKRGVIDALVNEGLLIKRKQRNNYWSTEKMLEVSQKVFSEHPEFHVLPPLKKLKEAGYGGYARAIGRFQGGILAFRQLLAEKMGIPLSNDLRKSRRNPITLLESLLEEGEGKSN